MSDIDIGRIGKAFWAEAIPNDYSVQKSTKWRGPQDGLPPVGMEVEGLCRGVWKNGKVVAFVNDENGDWAVVQYADDWKACMESELRPIQSERDKAFEAMVDVAREAFQSKHDGEDASRIVAIAFYDAGYRKTC